MKFRKVIALLLALCMVLPMLPLQSQAAQAADTFMDSSNISVVGTNSFGMLLSEAITSEREAAAEAESEYEAGYSVTDLEIEGPTATVTYSALGEATLVVAVYTEDGIQLLASGKTAVSSEATEATVTIGGTMPEYFYASAYLVDSYDFSPLCASYETPMYTRDMQELLASTIHDYDADRVLNLDGDETTNFAVFAEDTIVLREQAGVNTVASANDETMVYVIENADAAITSLTEGDVLAYPYGEDDILIVKVATITVDGTTATITGRELEMEEAFAAVKIDAATPYYEVDTGTANEGVTYINGPHTQNADASASHVSSCKLELDIGETNLNGQKIEIKGSLAYMVTTSVTYYVTASYKKLEVKFDFFQTFSLNISGKREVGDGIKLGELKVYALPGVSVKMNLRLLLEASGEMSFSSTVKSTVGACFVFYGDNWSPHLIWVNPAVEYNTKLEGKFFVGLGLTPSFEILEGILADVKIDGQLGVEFSAGITPVSTGSEGNSKHDCSDCLDGDISFTYKVTPSVTLLNWDNLHFTVDWSNVKIKFLDFYWSVDHTEFGFGTCPYVSYRTVIAVLDADNSPAPGVTVSVSGKTLTTNESGIAQVYLLNGAYPVTAAVNGREISGRITVADKCQKVILAAFLSDFASGIAGSVNSEMITDFGAVMSSGSCGNNLSWFLTESGTLIFSGTGDMKNQVMPDIYDDGPPWYYYRYYIKSVQMPEGVTGIGNYAFYDLYNLVSVSIPDTVKKIGSNAFYECTGITGITIPDGVTEIGSRAFYGCSSLTDIVIPEGLTKIREYTFYHCSSLNSIAIPDGVAEIGYNAFCGCSSLTCISIPASVTKIGWDAFGSCSQLREITFLGDAPATDATGSPFSGVSATAYYPANNSTWTYDVMQSYGGTLTWVPYETDKSGNRIVNDAAAVTDSPDAEAATEEPAPGLSASIAGDLVIEEQPNEDVSPDAFYGGEYSTDVLDTYTLKTATFTGLVPGAEYVMLAMKSIETEDILAADNLLGILQGTAAEDGTLIFRYVQRVDTDISYVIACGPSGKNLADAAITFPEMTADGSLQVVNPTVVYDSNVLTEGVDYTITGTVDFTEAGEYICYITGIHSYTGSVTCTYTVAAPSFVLGDVNSDGSINILDAKLIVSHYNEVVGLTGAQLLAADVNGDGKVDILDANLIAAFYNKYIDTFPAA